MISRAELKSAAKQSLSGKWGFAIALTLIITLFSALNIIPLLGSLVLLVITPALTYIPQQMFLRIKRNEQPDISEIFSSIINNLGAYWGIIARIFLQLLPWFALMLIGTIISGFSIVSSFSSSLMNGSGISAASNTFGVFALLGTILNLVGSILFFTNSFYYVLAIYVKTDYPSLTCKEAVLKSKELMTGHRIEYFILTLSFIGWFFLIPFTFGIATFYVLPYMQTTIAAYYDALSGRTNEESFTEEAAQF